METSLHI